ncbi:MAG: rhomboid family intramembrane serine protease [Bacteroidia bacterium]|nr:rhomboid family intramembrane serine protease [Bacteroidia bacterium]
MTLTTGIIAITVLVSWYVLSKPDILKRMMMNPYRIQNHNEYYRFITSGLIHANFSHLLWNMFTLYFFGNVVEQYFSYIFGNPGPYYFIAFYLMAIVVSDLPTFFKNRTNPGYNSLGASGGVAAVLFASVIFQPLEKICFYLIICLPGFILAIGYLMYSYFSGRKSNDNINHDAHLYGALFGFLFCAVLHPSSIPYFIEQISQYRVF